MLNIQHEREIKLIWLHQAPAKWAVCVGQCGELGPTLPHNPLRQSTRDSPGHNGCHAALQIRWYDSRQLCQHLAVMRLKLKRGTAAASNVPLPSRARCGLGASPGGDVRQVIPVGRQHK